MTVLIHGTHRVSEPLAFKVAKEVDGLVKQNLRLVNLLVKDKDELQLIENALETIVS